MNSERHLQIGYSSPEKAREQGEELCHRFDCTVGGERVGAAEVMYCSKPIPLYQVSELYVEYDHKGKGYASALLNQVEAFLVQRKKPGVLVDGILPNDPASGMYLRRGWKEVPDGLGLHVYNWPEDVSFEVLKGYSSRYTDWAIREGKPFDKE